MKAAARLALAVIAAALFCTIVLGLAAASANAQVPQAAATYRGQLVRAAHSQWGLDAPVAVLAAQVHQESRWRPDAMSHVGARGLGQFMPATATWWCELNRLPLSECQPENPTWALRALVGYDKWLFERTPQRYAARDRLWVVLRGYNGGLGHWQAEARIAPGGLQGAAREAVDAACGRAKRAPIHCAENLGYPRRILGELAPLYASWGVLQ